MHTLQSKTPCAQVVCAGKDDFIPESSGNSLSSTSRTVPPSAANLETAADALRELETVTEAEGDILGAEGGTAVPAYTASAQVRLRSA